MLAWGPGLLGAGTAAVAPVAAVAAVAAVLEGATGWTFLVMGLQLASAALYLLVGMRVGRRRVSHDAMLAVKLFQFWWYGLAALSLVSPALLVLTGLVGELPIPLWVALIDGLLGLICLAFLGLVYYLLYLYLGRRWILWPLSVFYGLLYLACLALIAYANVQGFDGTGVNAKPRYEHDLQGSPAAAALGLALIVPPLASAVAYSLLYFRVHDPTARYRILLVSGSIMVWFGVSLLGQALHLSTTDHAWQLVSMLVSVTAAAAILVAYLPPAWIRRKLGVESITAERAG